MKRFLIKNKNLILMAFVLSILLIGSTYALLTIDLFGEKTNSFVVGNLELTLNEDSCNGITVAKGIPVTDLDGMKQVACTFTVENTGNLDNKYYIYIDDMELKLDEERVNDFDIKYGFVRNGSTAKVGLLSSLGSNPNRLLDSNRIAVGEITIYELRFWVDYNASKDSMNKTFLTKIRLVSEVDDFGEVIPNITDYYNYEYVEQIDFNGDGSDLIDIYANQLWLTTDFHNAVATNVSFTDSLGNIWNPGDPLPNPGSTFIDDNGNKPVESFALLFYDFGADSLDLSLWDTSNVTNMNGMFENNWAKSINLKYFDTSNVTNMSSMFAGARAKNIDVSGFDTSNVTKMTDMFAWSGFSSLVLNNFDTSNVTDMSYMFDGSAATTLDVSGFDTSKVADMSGMFESSVADPIYVKDQAMLDRLVADGSADGSRLQIK